MTPFAVFNPLTGKILRVGIADRQIIPFQAQEGERWTIVSSEVRDNTHYVSDTILGVVSPRMALPEFDKVQILADGNDIAQIVGLPQPTKVTILISGMIMHEEEVEDGEVKVTSQERGLIRVLLEPPAQYMRKEVNINAV